MGERERERERERSRMKERTRRMRHIYGNSLSCLSSQRKGGFLNSLRFDTWVRIKRLGHGSCRNRTEQIMGSHHFLLKEEKMGYLGSGRVGGGRAENFKFEI